MAESLNNVLVVRATHNDGTANDETYTMMRAASVMDWVMIATDAVAAGVTLQNGANAISGVVDANSLGDTRVLRQATGDPWVTAERDLAVGDVLTFNPAAATGDWESYAYLYPTPAVAE